MGEGFGEIGEGMERRKSLRWRGRDWKTEREEGKSEKKRRDK